MMGPGTTYNLVLLQKQATFMHQFRMQNINYQTMEVIPNQCTFKK